MKPNQLAIALLYCAGLASSAESNLNTADLEHARVYLRQTQDLVVGATQGLSKAQWNFKPAPDRWSIAEIVEHMVLAQEFVLGPVRQQLAKAASPRERDTKQEDEILIGQMPDRTMKFQAPEFLKPTGRWTPAESMERLKANYVELKKYLEATPDLRQHAVDAPAVKAISKGAYDSMDGYQAILLAAGHTERHTKQLLEVRADAHFPQ
jgi:hypothetical protein